MQKDYVFQLREPFFGCTYQEIPEPLLILRQLTSTSQKPVKQIQTLESYMKDPPTHEVYIEFETCSENLLNYLFTIKENFKYFSRICSNKNALNIIEIIYRTEGINSDNLDWNRLYKNSYAYDLIEKIFLEINCLDPKNTNSIGDILCNADLEIYLMITEPELKKLIIKLKGENFYNHKYDIYIDSGLV